MFKQQCHFFEMILFFLSDLAPHQSPTPLLSPSNTIMPAISAGTVNTRSTISISEDTEGQSPAGPVNDCPVSIDQNHDAEPTTSSSNTPVFQPVPNGPNLSDETRSHVASRHLGHIRSTNIFSEVCNVFV